MSAQEEKKRGLFGRLFGGAPASEPAPSPEAAPEVEQTPSEVSQSVAPAPSGVIIAEAPAAAVEKPEPAQKGGWFSRLKAGLTKTSSKLSEGITGLFTKSRLDIDTLDDLEDVLIQADLGVETATRITTALSQGRYAKGISQDDVRTVLADEVERVLVPVARPLVLDTSHKPHVILVVGVNSQLQGSRCPG